MSARFIQAAPDGTRVATVDKRTLHADLIAGVAKAVREGVDVELLDGLRAFRDVDDLRIVNSHESRLKALEDGIRESRRRADVQLRAAEDCQTPEEEAAVRDLARKHLQDAANKSAEREALERHRDRNELDSSFVGEVDYLLTALSALATEDCRVDSETAHALRTVLKDLTVEVRGSRAHWTVSVLLPVDGRVALLGPITGDIPIRGVPTSDAHRALAPEAGTAKKHRVRAKQQLQDAGYSEIAATVAAMAPQPELVPALLGEEPTWDATPSAFDSSAFNKHLQNTYDSLTTWGATNYCLNNPTRQRTVDFVAANGGEISLEELSLAMPELGLTRSNLNGMLDGRKTSSGNVVSPVLRRTGLWKSHRKYWPVSMVANILCPGCGEPATGASLIPELPGGLICRACLIAPAIPGLIFPDIYASFALKSAAP